MYRGRLQTVRKHDGKQSQDINRVKMGGGEAVKRFPLFISLHFQPFYYEVAFKKKKKQEQKIKNNRQPRMDNFLSLKSPRNSQNNTANMALG